MIREKNGNLLKLESAKKNLEGPRLKSQFRAKDNRKVMVDESKKSQ